VVLSFPFAFVSLLFFFVFSTTQGRERILDRQDHVHSFLAHLLLSLSLSLSLFLKKPALPLSKLFGAAAPVADDPVPVAVSATQER
jgi:hypothetical protein